MRALLWRKRTRLLLVGFGFLRWLRNLWESWRLSPHTMQWSQRETHTLIKTLAHPGVTHENWPFNDMSSHGGLRLLEAESEAHKMNWNDSGVTPGGVKLTSSERGNHVHLQSWRMNFAHIQTLTVASKQDLFQGEREYKAFSIEPERGWSDLKSWDLQEFISSLPLICPLLIGSYF